GTRRRCRFAAAGRFAVAVGSSSNSFAAAATPQRLLGIILAGADLSALAAPRVSSQHSAPRVGSQQRRNQRRR
ncbi:Hypothetical predicted protein, partial [Olea europaea subsp. europaea]